MKKTKPSSNLVEITDKDRLDFLEKFIFEFRSKAFNSIFMIKGKKHGKFRMEMSYDMQSKEIESKSIRTAIDKFIRLVAKEL